MLQKPERLWVHLQKIDISVTFIQCQVEEGPVDAVEIAEFLVWNELRDAEPDIGRDVACASGFRELLVMTSRRL